MWKVEEGGRGEGWTGGIEVGNVEGGRRERDEGMEGGRGGRRAILYYLFVVGGQKAQQQSLQHLLALTDYTYSL